MIKWNESRYRYVFGSPAGPVGQDMRRKGIAIQAAARAIATEEGLVRTGRYRSSIGFRLLREAGGLVLRVGSAVPHARLLERGTQPHVIAARPPKKGLWWDMPNDRGWMEQPDSGRPVRYVLHPGNRPYRVLHRAVVQVLKGLVIA